MDKAMRNELNHFDVDLQRLPDVVTFVSGLIKVCSPNTQRVACNSNPPALDISNLFRRRPVL